MIFKPWFLKFILTISLSFAYLSLISYFFKGMSYLMINLKLNHIHLISQDLYASGRQSTPVVEVFLISVLFNICTGFWT